VVFRVCVITSTFLLFLRFFQNPKSRDFLRFFAVFRTFSQTMVDVPNHQRDFPLLKFKYFVALIARVTEPCCERLKQQLLCI